MARSITAGQWRRAERVQYETATPPRRPLHPPGWMPALPSLGRETLECVDQGQINGHDYGKGHQEQRARRRGEEPHPGPPGFGLPEPDPDAVAGGKRRKAEDNDRTERHAEPCERRQLKFHTMH